MITALIIANLALTVGLMSTVKQVKKINKGIEDIGSNIAQIQKSNFQIGTNITKSKNEITREFNAVHKRAIAYPSPLVFLKSK